NEACRQGPGNRDTCRYARPDLRSVREGGLRPTLWRPRTGSLHCANHRRRVKGERQSGKPTSSRCNVHGHVTRGKTMTDGEPLVVVVDDDEDIREIIKMILESDGYRVETVGDGMAAWQEITEHGAPSLILVDLMMPRMDGEGFMKMLRSSP